MKKKLFVGCVFLTLLFCITPSINAIECPVIEKTEECSICSESGDFLNCCILFIVNKGARFLSWLFFKSIIRDMGKVEMFDFLARTVEISARSTGCKWANN